jgi:hypothetical protein
MRKHHQHIASPAKIFLYSGICILFFALLYLVVNSGDPNTAVHLWVPFIMAGVALVLTSIFIK